MDLVDARRLRDVQRGAAVVAGEQRRPDRPGAQFRDRAGGVFPERIGEYDQTAERAVRREMDDRRPFGGMPFASSRSITATVSGLYALFLLISPASRF